LLADARLKYMVKGFLDARSDRHGSTVGGIPVYGSPDDALTFAAELGIDDLLVIRAC